MHEQVLFFSVQLERLMIIRQISMSNSTSSIAEILSNIQERIAPSIYSIEFIFSIVNCSCTILLLSRRQFRPLTYCLCKSFLPFNPTRSFSHHVDFFAASLAMLFNLVFGLASDLYLTTKMNFIVTSVIFCKLRGYFIQSSAMMYRWFLVAACFDRYAISSNNVRLRHFAQMYVARRVTAMNITLGLILPIHIPVVYVIKDGNCGPLQSLAVRYYHSVFVLLGGCLFPALLMIVSAFLTYHNLVLKWQRRQMIVVQPVTEMEDIQRKRDRQVLITLISQVIVFVITILPSTIFYFFVGMMSHISVKSNRSLAIERFSTFTVDVIMNLFPISSFYLYILSSSLFHNEFLVILRIVWKKMPCVNNIHRVVPTGTSQTNPVHMPVK